MWIIIVAMNLDTKKTLQFVNQTWDNSIIPTLCEYIRIPNKSPAYDPNWQSSGHMEKAVELLADWCRQQNLPGMQLQIHRAVGRTPLLMIEIPGQSAETVILYGHLDKQPEMSGWQPDLSPWNPVIKNQRLYGRGSADDGYAVFAALTAIKVLQQQKIPHARCVILIEASEESGSHDLPYYVNELEKQIGIPSLVICLDSGCGNYDQLWCTTSLRGLVSGKLKIKILTEGVHSGAASGAVPSSFRILRQLLSRIEDENNGKILLKDFHVKIPATSIKEAKKTAAVLKNQVWTDYPLVKNAKPKGKNAELILNRTWRPTLSITGVEGIPEMQNAGNVLRPMTGVMLSFRLPPTCDAEKAAKTLKTKLETKPPYNAEVTLEIKDVNRGWKAPVMQTWLTNAVKEASQHYYGKEALFWGEGGSIPFMGMLGKKFPKAQFMITGVLGPKANAHGPNEFLDIPMAKKLTCCVAEVLAKHYQHYK